MASKESIPQWAWHDFVGSNPACERCGLSAHWHRGADTRKRSRPGQVYKKRPEHDNRPRSGQKRERVYDKSIEWIGIDGEGQGRDIHNYIFLAASTEDGTRRWSVENPNGLSSMDLLGFIMSLPTWHSRIFCYSFNYDITKIIQDLPNHKIYRLMRPEHPTRRRIGAEALKGPRPIRWNYFSINMQSTRFSIGLTGMKRRVIWDIWKFFQSKFVDALKEWKVGDPEVLKEMQYMKDHRAEFDKLPFERVKEYCFNECAYMASLARKLWDAHNKVGLRLKNFYGAGSSASAMLDVMSIKEMIAPTPEAMRIPVAQAYTGGRFENSVLGVIQGPIYNYDISSAYPYQIYFLPCLLHARWEHTTDERRISECAHALVHYGLPNTRISKSLKSWGPFPYRITTSERGAKEQGAICFPASSGGGWVWRDEFVWGQKLFGHVQFKEAWLCHSDCSCHPFKDIPKYYLERLAIGKEGPGIVLKLGINSCYGKLAQSVGLAQFASWVWAGMITSGCRSQLLELLSLHHDRKNCLMMATDGIYTRERLSPPKPKETGTDIDVIERATGKVNHKPLGGWEEKFIEWLDSKGKETPRYDESGKRLYRGVFVARPGIYFPLNPTAEEIKTVRGRGVGKGVILENWKEIIAAWEQGKETVDVTNVSRFCGAKTSISESGKKPNLSYKRAYALPGMNKPAYGQWITRKVQMSFDPMPKRKGVNADGLSLKLREMPLDIESMPYPKAMRERSKLSVDARMMQTLHQEMLEQPDVDFADYEPLDE